jgi:hypothetical protein
MEGLTQRHYPRHRSVCHLLLATLLRVLTASWRARSSGEARLRRPISNGRLGVADSPIDNYSISQICTITRTYLEPPIMDAISYSAARANLASTMDRVCNDHEAALRSQARRDSPSPAP